MAHRALLETWYTEKESNLRQLPYQSSALTPELPVLAEDTGFEPVWVLPRGLSRTVQLATLPIFQVGSVSTVRALKLPELI